MKNPLVKRLPRELKEDIGKYAVIFLFFVIIIGVVSGYLVADDSLIKAYNESFEKYNIEDGNLEFLQNPDSETISDIEQDAQITLYKNFYKDEETLGFDSKLRIFGERNEVDKVCLMDGEMPAGDNDIAIDRLYAKNHELTIGSNIEIDGKVLDVCGIVALSDYSSLFESPSDLMFDNDKFGVGVMSDDGFESVRDNHIHYSYAWLYSNKPANDDEAKEMAEDLMEKVSSKAMLSNFLPEYINQAIIFTGNDMGGDKKSMMAFLYITVIILAFIFAITTDSTITKEAGAIGTLRATGYTRGELVRHYMILPMTILFIGAIIGNILGYTWLEEYMAGAYYGSYSLTNYELIFNPDAFILTTVIPFIIMFLINLVTLVKKMRISPLRFIRRDLGRKNKKKAFRLNTKIPIMTRFRLRIIFQNISNYITIAAGILLANIILFFGMAFKPLLLNYQDTITDNLLAANIYVLKIPAETETPDAEKAASVSLTTLGEDTKAEDVSIYGIQKDSRYVNISHDGDGVAISTAYANKYDIKTGDTITLKEKYGSKKYELKVQGTYDYPSIIAVFMDSDRFNELFDKEDGYFNIYLSDSEIDDIDDALIASKINVDDFTKTSRQLIRSMGSMMSVFLIFGVILFVLVIYLLAKIIIEKNAQSISMAKILGYSNSEINSLYIHSTTIVTILSIICTIPLVDRILKVVFKVVFMEYSGYMAYEVSPLVMVKAGLIGFASYACAALILNAKVKKVPLAEALKNLE